MNKDTNRNSVHSTQDMEQIQRGLEEFLKREMQDMERSGSRQSDMEYEDAGISADAQTRPGSAKPQFFTIDEEEEYEREIDIISTQKKTGSRRSGRYEDDYVEDWDSREPRRRVREDSAPRRRQSGAGSSPGTNTRSGSNSNRAGRNSDSGRRNSERRSGRTSEREYTRREPSQRDNRSGRYDRSYEEDQYEERYEERYNKSANKGERDRAGKNPKKKKKSKLKRFLIILVIIIALLAAGLYYLVGRFYSKMNFERNDVLAAEPMKEDGVVNILLIGNDSRTNGEDGRSDAMILLSVSNKTDKIYMTSLLRDMYVDIPGHDSNRLNAAYAYGGAELLMETIEKNFDITVNRYVLVNFEAFANLIDAVGGVELELTSEEIEYVNAYLVEYNMLLNRPQGTDNMDTSVSGLVHLNGAQALAYSRNRYLGTDFGRTERQRKVLTAAIGKLPKALVANPNELINTLMPNLTTNLTQQECYQLSLMAPKVLTYEIVQNCLPIEGSYKNTTIRKMSVLEVDFEANKKFIRENIYGEGNQTNASAETTP